MFYATSDVLIYPKALARGYKTLEFCENPYDIKIHFRFFISHKKSPKWTITILIVVSPLVGIIFLAIPFAYDFASKICYERGS